MTTAQELYMNLTPHVLAACVSKPGDMTSAKQMADAIVRECVGECARLGLLEDVRPATQEVQAAGPAQFGAPEFVTPAPAPIPPVEAVGYGPQGLARFVEAQTFGNGGIPVIPVGQPHQPAQHYNVIGGPSSAQPSAPAAASAAPWYPPHLAHLHQPQAMPPTAVPPQVQSPVAAQPAQQQSAPWYPPHLAHLFKPQAPPAPTVPVVGSQGPGYVQEARIASGAGTVAQQQQPYDVAGQKIVPPHGNTFQPPNQAGVMNNVVMAATPTGHSALGTDGVIAQPIQRPNSQDMIVAPANQPVVTQAGGAGTQFVPEHIVR
jgi:hypothetical protein